MRDPSGSDPAPLKCSFCGKSQNAVGKLISSPSDHPRAFICNECIAVCVTILADDRRDADAANADPVNKDVPGEPHPLLGHPLASELMAAVVEWVRHESLGRDAAEQLAQVRTIAEKMVADASN